MGQHQPPKRWAAGYGMIELKHGEKLYGEKAPDFLPLKKGFTNMKKEN